MAGTSSVVTVFETLRQVLIVIDLIHCTCILLQSVCHTKGFWR
jgi:hypothetical protein